jgi:hypothetical protein
MSAQWMSTVQVAEESGRHVDSVKRALARGLLVGSQARAGCRWRVSRVEFDRWMEGGAEVDDPRRSRLRRAS